MRVGGQNMDKDPVRIGRINIKVEKALGYDFGENIFCYISEAKLREFASRWPSGYLRKVEESAHIMRNPLYVGIDTKNKRLYYIKEYLVNNSFFRKACLVLSFEKQLSLIDIVSLDEKKMALISRTTKFVMAKA